VTDQEDFSSFSEAEWADEQARTRRFAYLSGIIGAVVVPALAWVALVLAGLTSTGTARDPLTVAWMFVLVLPVLGVIVSVNVSQQRKSDRTVGGLTRRQQFESRLANALDMAEGEPEVIDVIERSLASTLPDSPVELLLADNSHAHLLRMATVSPTGLPPACGVDSPDRCPAARRAQIQRFATSDDLDACPKLRGRADGAISALCVPVSIMGRTVGVIHATSGPHTVVAEHTVHDLATLAKLAGARIGLLRVMADTQLQAATDSLTGLMNRRSFEQKVSAVRAETAVLSVAISDLDNFKALNDTYGHDTGDRALRLVAKVLTESVRAQDLVCRHGGEEFVIALPGCNAANGRDILDAARVRLAAAVTVAGLPKFTVSFGIIDAEDKEDLPSLISRADTALYQAKRDGRDQVVVHDTAGNTVTATAGPATLRGLDSRKLQHHQATIPKPSNSELRSPPPASGSPASRVS
jgi:diguanylate cyclase (GGDEF)-like protein